MRQKHPLHHFQSGLQTSMQRMILGVAALLCATLPMAHADDAVPTRTTLTATPVDTGTRAGVTLSAKVETTTGTPVDAGTVDFMLASGQSLGSAIVGADGNATLVVAQLPKGSASSVDGSNQVGISAVYNATAATTSFGKSSSVAAAVATPAATTQLPDFTVTGNPTTVTVAQGSYGTSTLTITSVGGYAGSIQLSCSNLPAQVTCAFNPTQQNLTADGSFASTLQIQTQAASGTSSASLLSHTNLALALAFPGGLMLLGLSRRRKTFRGAQMLGIAMLLAGTGLGLSGCSQRYGYLHHPPSVATGTLPGTYSLNIAVDGSQGSAVAEHTLTVSLVVQ